MTSKDAQPRHDRSRVAAAVWLGAVICLGLAARADVVGLPPFLAKYGADALWAIMVFLGVGFGFPGWSTGAVAGVAIAISGTVEVSQLYHAPWIDAIRRTTLGHLALGDTFAFGDIGAYLVGIALAATVDWAAHRIRWRSRKVLARVVDFGGPQMNDPFDLNRFVVAQERDFSQALSEIKNGQKRSHWMWYVFPQFAGLGFSSTAQRYAIKSVKEAQAYLAHPVLGPRLNECAEAAARVEGRSATEIFGSPDDLKLKSSATLFALVSPPGSVFERLLDKYYSGQRDGKTLRLVGKEPSL